VITYLKIGAIAIDRSQDIPERAHNWRGRRKQELVIASSFCILHPLLQRTMDAKKIMKPRARSFSASSQPISRESLRDALGCASLSASLRNFHSRRSHNKGGLQ